MNEDMHDGSLYLPREELLAAQSACLEKQYDYNHSRPSEVAKRAQLLQEMFAEIGPHCYIEPPLHANWAGHFAHFGDHIYANFNLTLVDDTHIYVGDNTMFGPNVTIATGAHPILPALRRREYQFNQAVHIGENCWFGSGAIVLPGITIGNNVVVGAGSVVTHDLPDNVVAVGNPARVLRPINDHDKEVYFKDRKIDWNQID
ncbi:sugar O-acetyltransferase [Lacticaseibacillus yichunensis]|uniref:Acetyltransferase n=1 Tax=Lacticaseibacillus yichunensis TaxID=2486015 RepID=A0ABW4CRJ2_9LACO|nr:sugar O-acetyltransferase [Lacticaseibacillus yichunensis]